MLLVLVILMVGIALLAGLTVTRRQGRHRPERPQMPASELLRKRYARGELTRQDYQQGLVDVLTDRYVQGEIDLGAYEARLARLLAERIGDAPGQEPRAG